MNLWSTIMPTGTPAKTKICPICRDEFLPDKPSQRYCKKDHYSPCPVCGKPVLWNSARKDVPVCSKECGQVRRKQRSLKKYGVEHPMQLKEIQDKHKASVKEHFGVEHPLQSQEVKNKAVQTNREKFGTDWALGNKKFHEKCSETMEQKYGARTTLQSEQLKQKVKKTMIERYGVENPNQSDEIRSKIKATNLKIYGYENAMQNKSVQTKCSNTRKQHKDQINENIRKAFQAKYGVGNCRKSPVVIAKIKQSLMDHYGVDVPFKDDEIKRKAMKTNMERYGVPWYTMTEEYKNGRQFIVNPNQGCISNVNRKFAKKLESYGIKEIQFEKKIGTKLFDICIPELKTVIEIDPAYTHNTAGLNHFNRVVDLEYHLEKTKVAEENGYRCIHVFDWDDWDKVIQLVLPTKRIYARKCSLVKIVNPSVAKKFINENHIQSQARGALLTLGLVYDNELVECMSFGKSRYNRNYTYELLRLCSKTGVSVVGGASKLFKLATQQLELDSIISYCDASKFQGKVYEAIGMNLVKKTKPAIVWSKEGKKITSNLLRQRGFDQLFNTRYGKGTDNEILMLEHGWLPVPDCGQKVFEYND